MRTPTAGAAPEQNPQMTPMEQVLWDAIQADAHLSGHFHPQQWVLDGKYRVDFLDPVLKLAIEADDLGTHSTEGGMERDSVRNQDIGDAGFKIVHYSYFQIRNNLPWVLRRIQQARASAHVRNIRAGMRTRRWHVGLEGEVA